MLCRDFFQGRETSKEFLGQVHSQLNPFLCVLFSWTGNFMKILNITQQNLGDELSLNLFTLIASFNTID